MQNVLTAIEALYNTQGLGQYGVPLSTTLTVLGFAVAYALLIIAIHRHESNR